MIRSDISRHFTAQICHEAILYVGGDGREWKANNCANFWLIENLVRLYFMPNAHLSASSLSLTNGRTTSLQKLERFLLT